MANSLRTFGGCKKLASEYRAIGISLLRFEHACASMLVGTNSSRAISELRIDVANIATETLETYLDDLVNPEIPLEELYLVRGKLNLLSLKGVTLVALGLAALVGFITIATDFPLATSSAASPFILVAALFALSRHRTVRRLRFAHVLRTIISKRNGSGRTRTATKPRIVVNRNIGSAAA